MQLHLPSYPFQYKKRYVLLYNIELRLKKII